MIDFPNSPTTGQTFTDSNGTTWEFNGTYWKKVRETDFGSYFGLDILDEDDMASNRADALATQQSIVAYVQASLADRTPIEIVASIDTLTIGHLRRLVTYSHVSQVQITVPTGVFAAGDWFWLQSINTGGITLLTPGLTVNGGSPVTVSQGNAMTVVFTGATNISVFGGEPAA